jgi:hypothetical protein
MTTNHFNRKIQFEGITTAVNLICRLLYLKIIQITKLLMRKERLELSQVTPLVPKTSASTNSATFALKTNLDDYGRKSSYRCVIMGLLY